jgi:hypothetical protein
MLTDIKINIFILLDKLNDNKLPFKVQMAPLIEDYK